ncbi:hypothetical protein GCM10010112_10550 [Actinoplanes lobatus]|uniref:SH3b domain-containing protein n=1 Tax=Actinoplanes lobatus TaxID=113568 RepID=A0ABQ4A9A1_9ACTN|nr:hypothetical protein GCM10010112_10550 [Actinoplanes lobatus]GIE37579.1 hypothetical protein Alo02nite_04770 [Actinoplanes lobatus]
MRPHTFRVSRGFAAAVVTALLPVAAIVGLTPAPASASCSHSHSNLDDGSDTVVGTSTGLNIRTGPHTACAKAMTGAIPNGASVALHCWTAGDRVIGYYDTDTWSYVRYGTVYGWVSDAYLSGQGSDQLC